MMNEKVENQSFSLARLDQDNHNVVCTITQVKRKVKLETNKKLEFAIQLAFVKQDSPILSTTFFLIVLTTKEQQLSNLLLKISNH